MFFFINLYLQQVLGLGAFASGAALLPLTVTIMVGMIAAAPRLIGRFGPKTMTVAGLATLAAGLVWLSLIRADGSFLVDVLPALVSTPPAGFDVTVYPVIALPPVFEGAVNVTVACALPGVAATPVGAPGTPIGVTLFEAADAAPTPAAFVAVTVKVYAVPLVSPVTMCEVDVLPLAAIHLAPFERDHGEIGTHETRRRVGETERRRARQIAFNEANGITPRSIVKRVRDLIDGVYSEKASKEKEKQELQRALVEDMSEKDVAKEIKRLEKQMLEHARNLEFEKAARVRDQLALLKEQAFGAAVHDNVVPIQAGKARS